MGKKNIGIVSENNEVGGGDERGRSLMYKRNKRGPRIDQGLDAK